MSSALKNGLQIVLMIIVGALVGFAVAVLSAKFGYISDDAVRFIDRSIGGFLRGASDTGAAGEKILYSIMLAVRDLPPVLCLGVLFGVSLLWVRYKRVLIYSVLLWPLSSHVFLVFATEFSKTRYGEGVENFWARMHLPALVIEIILYGCFFAIAYGAYRAAQAVARRRTSAAA